MDKTEMPIESGRSGVPAIEEQSMTLLTAEELKKIRAEERARKEIRDELSPPRPTGRFWSFLNSPLGLLLVSSMIVGGFGKLITQKLESIDKKRATEKEAIKYLSELDERIFQMRFFLIKVDTSKTFEQKRYFSTGFGAVKLGAKQWYHPVFGDFSEVGIQAIIQWFNLNVDTINPENTKSALTAIQSIIVDDRGILVSTAAAYEAVNKLEQVKEDVEKELRE